MSELGLIATEVIEDEFPYLTGTDRSVAISNASGWFENNIGKLNNLIYSSYSGVDPGLCLEERSIYKAIYLSDYFRSKAGAVLKNMDSDVLQWISLSEGDSTIRLQNKNEVSKSYVSMSKEYKQEAKDLVWAYNLYGAYPRSVDLVYLEDYVSTGQSQAVLGGASYLQAGSVEIEAGSSSVEIPLSLSSLPQSISISMVKPSDTDPNVSFAVVGNSISSTGFKVSLGGFIPSTGYLVNYGVR